MKKFTLKSPVTILIISWLVGGFALFIKEPEAVHYTFKILSTLLFVTAVVVYIKD